MFPVLVSRTVSILCGASRMRLSWSITSFVITFHAAAVATSPAASSEPCHEVHYNRLMSDAEVERLYRAMESLRIEVVQYRADLNGRLRTLEVHSAEVDAREDQRVMTRSVTLAYIAGIAAVTGIISAVVTNLL